MDLKDKSTFKDRCFLEGIYTQNHLHCPNVLQSSERSFSEVRTSRSVRRVALLLFVTFMKYNIKMYQFGHQL